MREKEKTTGVIFVRHGQADFPSKRLYCDDREDPGLTERGLEQARHAGVMLAGEQVDVIYASPMNRTRTTAAAIVDATGAPLHFDVRLKERPFGIWDGLYFDDIARDYPEDFKAWKSDPVFFVPEGGEAINDHMTRVTDALAGIVAAHPGQLIVVVAHVGPIRMCITEALTMPIAAYRRLTIDYGSLTRVEYGAQQNNLIYLNICHRP
jgi:ribonuclease H / adenosylcobalamin/alpha-ribazole phosphatase